MSDTGKRARMAAEASMTRTGASTARVEKAWLNTGNRALTSGYRRTGQAWTARRAGGGTRWTPLPRQLAAS